MTTPTTTAAGTHAGGAAPTTASASVDTADRSRFASRRELILLVALVALVAAVGLFGLVFPGLLAPAVAIAVLAAIIALDWLLPSGELRQIAGRIRKH